GAVPRFFLELHDAQRVRRALAGLDRVEAVEARPVRDEAAPAHPFPERVDLGHEAHARHEVAVAPRVLAEHLDVAAAGAKLPRDEVEHRALAAAVGAQEPDDALARLERDVVQPHDLAVPAREVLRFDPGRAQAIPSFARRTRHATRTMPAIAGTASTKMRVHGSNSIPSPLPPWSICARSVVS